MSLETVIKGDMTAETAVPAPAATPERPDTIAGDGDRQHVESFLVRVLLNEDRSIRSTSIRHVLTDAERRWPGWKPQELPDFITAICSDSLVRADPEPRSAQLVPQGIPKPDAAGRPERQARFACTGLSVDRRVLRAAERFTATFTLDLAEPPAGMEQLTYTAFITAKALDDGPDREIAQATGPFAPGSPVIRIEAEGLAPGTYSLNGVVRLLEPGTGRPVAVAAPAESLVVLVVD